MQLTSGLRASRTWQRWLQSTQGRMLLGVRRRPACGARSGSAIWARVISTRSAVALGHHRLGHGRRRRSSPGPPPRPRAARAARSGGGQRAGRSRARCGRRAGCPPRRRRGPAPPPRSRRRAASSAARAGADLGGDAGPRGQLVACPGAARAAGPGPSAARAAARTWRANAGPVGAELVVPGVGQPGEELADQTALAGVDLHPVQPGRRGQRAAAAAKPSTTAAMSSASISWGTSRVAGSGKRDGAHRAPLAVGARALAPACGRATPAPAPPSACTAAATAAQPGSQSAARGARS